MSKRLPPSNAKYHKGYPKTSASDQSFVAGLLDRDTYNCDTCRDTHPVGIECPLIDPAATSRRLAELERLLKASQEREADAIGIIGDIEQIRSVEANSVTILCDNPEADDIEKQSAVEACGDYTGWETVRYHGKDWVEALHKAANASRSSYASEDRD